MWRAGATLPCGVWTSHCSGFSCRGARALGPQASVVVARRLQSTGSVVVAHGLSCSAACGIFPDQGSNPCPLHWQADSEPLHHQGSPMNFLKIKKINEDIRKTSNILISSEYPLICGLLIYLNFLHLFISVSILSRVKRSHSSNCNFLFLLLRAN